MPLDAPALRAILTELRSSVARDRMLAAERAAQWSGHLDPADAATIGRALADALHAETDPTAREAELNAVSEISSYGLMPYDEILRVLGAHEWVETWAEDLVSGLRDDLPYAPRASTAPATRLDLVDGTEQT